MFIVDFGNEEGKNMNAEITVIHALSDSTGETAAQVAKAASAQYPQYNVKIIKKPFMIDLAGIEEAVKEANEMNSIIMFTFVVPVLKEHLVQLAKEYNVTCIDIMGPVVDAISIKTGWRSNYMTGTFRRLDQEYFEKVAAIEFAVKYDDCKDPKGIKKADLVLLGISRTSKTPLSMYLANWNIKVTNVPLLPESDPPKEIYEIAPEKIIGLISDPHKLNAIRLERLKAHGLGSNANYASMERIAYELKYAEEIMKSIGCKVIDVTDKAIEETASIILQFLKEVNK